MANISVTMSAAGSSDASISIKANPNQVPREEKKYTTITTPKTWGQNDKNIKPCGNSYLDGVNQQSMEMRNYELFKQTKMASAAMGVRAPHALYERQMLAEPKQEVVA
jgi:hypothetical protein